MQIITKRISTLWHTVFFKALLCTLCTFMCVSIAYSNTIHIHGCFQDGHFENTYYSDFIANLAKVKYAGNVKHLC